MSDEPRVALETFTQPAQVSAFAQLTAAPSLPSDLLSLQQVLDGCTTTMPEKLRPYSSQLEGSGWRYSRTMRLLSYYYITTEMQPYLDAWTSRSDKPSERCDGGYIDEEFAAYDEGRWVLCFRPNGTVPAPYTHSLRLVSLREGRLEYVYPGHNTVFPNDIFGRRGDPELDLYEILPKVFMIGSRHAYNETGSYRALKRYGALRDVPPPERQAYIKWNGMATIGHSDTTVDCGWCLRLA